MLWVVLTSPGWSHWFDDDLAKAAAADAAQVAGG